MLWAGGAAFAPAPSRPAAGESPRFEIRRFIFDGATLVTGEQFVIGGADSVRGFTEREIIDDKGYRGTVEPYTPDIGAQTGVSGGRLGGMVFEDWGAVRRITPGLGERGGEYISSAGLGLRYGRGHSTSFRLDYAVVLNDGGLQRSWDARGHFSIAYVF